MRSRFAAVLFLPVLLALPRSGAAQCTNGTLSILTAQYDNLRDSVNSDETCLTPNAGTFYATDGVTPTFVVQATFQALLSGSESPIYAQPLYVPNVPIGGGTHNVIYTAALNNGVYAYDADNYGVGGAGVLYWGAALSADCTETSDGTTYPGSVLKLTPGPGVLLPYLGIVSTPVIDAEAGILYVVNACLVTNPSDYGLRWYLNALRITNGKPVAPAVSITGGVSNSFGNTPFIASYELQRSALLLTRNSSGSTEVYFSFGALTVEGAGQKPYHGWLFGYTLNSTGTALVQQSAFTTTPASSVFSSVCNPVISDGYQMPPNWCGEGGGMWMSGRGPAANTLDGDLYLFAAASNGGFQTAAPQNWSESILKFPMGAATTPFDSFTSSGWYVDENENDEDMGTSGIVLFDGLVDGNTRHFLAVTDKAGNLFLLAQQKLGGFNPVDDVLQEFLASSSETCPQTNVTDKYCNEPHSLVYWNDTLYMWPYQSPLRVFPFSNGQFAETPMLAATAQGFPGGILALSSNGTSNGILWAITSKSGYNVKGPATLWAIDAATLAVLWSSTNSFLPGTFAEPTVADGRVYVPTNNSGLLVYANH